MNATNNTGGSNTSTSNTATYINPSDLPHEHSWKPLWFLNLYRLSIAGFFTVMFYSDKLFLPLGSHSKQVFFATCLLYLAVAFSFTFLIRNKWPNFVVQVYLHIFTDIAAITILMHASGGITSGLGTLLIVSIAGGSIVFSGRHALLFASIASIAILGEEIYVQSEGLLKSNSYIQAGTLGLALFLTAIVVNNFAQRIRESEALATRRGIDLANMAQLTEHIIQRMQTGIIVVDHDNQIRLMNESARYMLGMPVDTPSGSLEVISPDIADQIKLWRFDPETSSQVIKASSGHAHVMPRFARIGQESNPGTLIFLEDTSGMARHAQQLQLASLGRLTASIAHEIRNPLGAISHAGQLLAESANIDEHDERLTRIISDQSKRMNTIVENIMQLSRRDRSNPELIQLKPFLNNFKHEFLSSHEVDEHTLLISLDPDDAEVRFDPTHLYQIVNNLSENGLRHTADYPGWPKIEIRAGILEESQRPYLDILDYGSGIDAEAAKHIFEPFFTTASSGTGLGLYISRELAECNQAHLNYVPMTSGGSCFRITFQDPRRQMH